MKVSVIIRSWYNLGNSHRRGTLLRQKRIILIRDLTKAISSLPALHTISICRYFIWQRHATHTITVPKAPVFSNTNTLISVRNPADANVLLSFSCQLHLAQHYLSGCFPGQSALWAYLGTMFLIGK